jgi:hypothetical protein
MKPVRLTACLLALFASQRAQADPCGMVPPIIIDNDVPITRVGLQKTYVFFQNGVETFVIRPGFSGEIDEFGMLIPFPEPPALRKVADDIFAHIEKAIDPPEVVIDVRPPTPEAAKFKSPPTSPAKKSEAPLEVHVVRVIREEAIGMYEVAVLEAGSAAALKRWMDDHRYKYPQGMDAVCEEYVKLRWCFVAVKTKVGQKSGVDPKPRMRKANGKLPSGSTFDGNVQAMGFRFRTKDLLVPMRLSAFNAGELRNVVYLLTDGPRRIRSIPEEYVVRQLTGEQLYGNITNPLPLRIIGGTEKDIPAWQKQSLAQRRDPRPHNGLARELFAADVLAVKQDRLSHPHEEAEKMLLRIGEHFGLRGPDIDRQNGQALAADRAKTADEAADGVKKLSLTVLDGDFPREVVGGQNLTFAEYSMPPRRNSPQSYDATRHGPAGPRQGVRHEGALSLRVSSSRERTISLGDWRMSVGMGLVMGIVFIGLMLGVRSRIT